MTPSAPRSIEDYLHALRTALAGADPALIQDALYDAEEHLRAEAAGKPTKSEADLLEDIARTYGSPEEVAAAYRDTEAKVEAALQPATSRAIWYIFSPCCVGYLPVMHALQSWSLSKPTARAMDSMGR